MEAGNVAMKCTQKGCTRAATLHITEILGEDQFEELHLCEECAQKYLYEPQQKASPKGGAAPADEVDEPGVSNRECPVCGIKFVEFRNSGRLGCPHDYQEFREELTPLLENIHGEKQHVGKFPKRAPNASRRQYKLIKLRSELRTAIEEEQYENAAKLRDQIQTLESELSAEEAASE